MIRQFLDWLFGRPRNPFDRNGDGRPGGSLPAALRGLDDLRDEAKSLGVDVDNRWGERRLREEIAKARGG